MRRVNGALRESNNRAGGRGGLILGRYSQTGFLVLVALVDLHCKKKQKTVWMLDDRATLFLTLFYKNE